MYSGIGSSLLGISVTNGYVRPANVPHCRSRINEQDLLLFLRALAWGHPAFQAGTERLEHPRGYARRTDRRCVVGTCAFAVRNGPDTSGSATTVLSNPLWVIQTSQAVHTMEESEKSPTARARVPGILETIKDILSNHGLSAFWRGVGPALVLVLNPVLQYTIFEQLKNLLVRRRTAKLKAAGIAVAAVSLLSDWDYFYLGAVSKLGEHLHFRWPHARTREGLIYAYQPVATSATYPYM